MQRKTHGQVAEQRGGARYRTVCNTAPGMHIRQRLWLSIGQHPYSTTATEGSGLIRIKTTSRSLGAQRVHANGVSPCITRQSSPVLPSMTSTAGFVTEAHSKDTLSQHTWLSCDTLYQTQTTISSTAPQYKSIAS